MFDLTKFSKNQAAFYASLKQNYSNIQRACDQTGISRSAHYDWFYNDSNYREAFDALRDDLVDIAQQCLVDAIQRDRNVPAALAFLKYHGKQRGYTESDITIKHEGDIKFVFGNLILPEDNAIPIDEHQTKPEDDEQLQS